jgi:hypothetical protein
MDIFSKPLGGVPSSLRGFAVSADRVADEAWVTAEIMRQFPEISRGDALRQAAIIVAREMPVRPYVKPR